MFGSPIVAAATFGSDARVSLACVDAMAAQTCGCVWALHRICSFPCSRSRNVIKRHGQRDDGGCYDDLDERLRNSFTDYRDYQEPTKVASAFASRCRYNVVDRYNCMPTTVVGEPTPSVDGHPHGVELL